MLCKLLQHNAVASICQLTDPRPLLPLIKQYDADETGFVAEQAHGCDLALFTKEAFFSKNEARTASPHLTRDRLLGGRGCDHSSE